MMRIAKSVLFFFFIISILLSLSACKTNIPENANYRVVFKYDDYSPLIDKELNDDEKKIIRGILSNKILGFDNPASPYREDVSIMINNDCYMLATDGSENIKINGMYITINENEYQQIYDIVSKYGVRFPCL